MTATYAISTATFANTRRRVAKAVRFGRLSDYQRVALAALGLAGTVRVTVYGGRKADSYPLGGAVNLTVPGIGDIRFNLRTFRALQRKGVVGILPTGEVREAVYKVGRSSWRVRAYDVNVGLI